MVEIELVKLSDELRMGKYPVTQTQWEAVMGNNPSWFNGPNNPVETVNWFEAREFCRKLTASTGSVFRLPTPGEWEWACRAGTTTRYSFGEEYAWIQRNSMGPTQPVGQQKPNPWGLYDMHGNVWEWCTIEPEKDDDEGEYPDTQPVRGGSLFLNRDGARVVCRFDFHPAARRNRVGFRVVLGG